VIAKDLTRIQVWVAVNEADIGSIHPGQAVSFTTDAFAGHVFQGQVAKIRLNASMTQNVVTYTVEVDTDNPDAKLLPYLTANVRFEVSRREGVLMVPNSALRWTPAPEQIAPDAQASAPAPDQARSSVGRSQAGDPGGRGLGGGSGRPAGGAGRGFVWVADGGRVRPIAVEVGVNDGVMTEVRGELLKEGLEVIVGEFEQSNGNETRSPFTPSYFRSSRQGT
jgi:HlyD family secretion protein